MSDDYANWLAALNGQSQPVYEGDPWCGYFAVQDRSSTTPARRWPLVACAIWRGTDGHLYAERAGQQVPVHWVWPYAALRPITHQTYQHWHATREWPEEAA